MIGMVAVQHQQPTVVPNALSGKTSGITSTGFRPLTIKSSMIEVTVYVPVSIWQDAEDLKNHINLTEECSQCDLLFHLSFAAERKNNKQLIQVFLDDLNENYLRGNDPHAVLGGLLKAVKIQEALTCYYRYVSSVPIVPPALFQLVQLNKARLMCVFGGQGNTEDYIGEIETILNTYSPIVNDVFEVFSEALLNVSQGSIDLCSWIIKRPSDPALIQVPSVSLSLAGVIQLLNFVVIAKANNMSLPNLADQFERFTGHSQGIISAVVVASSQSDEDFNQKAVDALKMLYIIGHHAEQVHPLMSLPPSILNDCSAHNEGVPTPMLSIWNMSYEQVYKHVESANAILPPNRQIEISLHNGPRSLVCSGPAVALHGLNVALRKIKAVASEDQSRIPHSKRKLKFSTRFLPITAPFHCSYLGPAIQPIIEDLERNGVNFDQVVLKAPVISPFDGSKLNSLEKLTRKLVSLICTEPVHWAKACDQPSITHIVDFGPGGMAGIGALSHRNKEGSGVRIIIGSALSKTPSLDIDDMRALFDRTTENVKFGVDWKKDFGPKLTKRQNDGKLFVETKFSKLIGLPPVMVAGMTPCTVSQTFVSACINSGYHVELAGGGHFTEKMLRDKIDGIMADIPAGRGITLNSLFLNPRLWSMQYPLMKKMREEGYPIEGVCIAAGVPSLENANEIVQSLHNSGIRHISFKPGSIDSIYQVIAIAKSNPKVPIVLQWTGGRGGGHHSFEDFHQPILETYAAIRACSNLVLVAGSGFGDGANSMPYLTGQWSEKFSFPWMPFDGILVASRVMVAKENLASQPVKELLVAAHGVDEESDWERTYSGPVGNIVTVKSELGEPIHKVATRSVHFWKELDDQIFSLPRGEKRIKVLLERKGAIIDRLNKDHMKVWFGRNKSGQICDLEEMTYEEVILRLVDLCYLKDQNRWIDSTYRVLIHEFLILVQSRFVEKECEAFISSPDELLGNPYELLKSFFARFPKIPLTTLRAEDLDKFLQICMNPVRKPVPFVPVLDDNFEYWFKKDSLWASEDVDAVPDKDVQRTCILQGPVAVKYSDKADVSVKDILDSINDYWIEGLCKLGVECRNSTWFGAADPLSIIRLESSTMDHETANGIQLKTMNYSPNLKESQNDQLWFAKLSGNREDWFSAALQSTTVVGEDKKLEANPFQSIFRPRQGYNYQVILGKDGGSTDSVTIEHKDRVLVKSFCKDNMIHLTINHSVEERTVGLELLFKFSPSYSPALLHAVTESREQKIREFYYALWFGSIEEMGKLEQLDPIKSQPIVSQSSLADEKQVRRFCATVGNSCAAYSGQLGKPQAPMDFAVILAWKAIIQCLFTPRGHGNLLNLVHLRNKIKVGKNSRLNIGDIVDTEAKISAVSEVNGGKMVEVTADLQKNGVVILTVVTAFLYRKNKPASLYVDYAPSHWRVPIKSDDQVGILADILKSKPWFIPVPDWHLKVSAGYDLVFEIHEKIAVPVSGVGLKGLRVSGEVVAMFTGHLSIPCGHIRLQEDEKSILKSDPIDEFCRRHKGIPMAQELIQFPQTEGMKEIGRVSAPLSAERYSQVSGDHNPIHTHPLIADLLGLPSGPIIHGMWTSAAVRALLEVHLAENNPQRIVEFETRYTDMVQPGSIIAVSCEHIGMQQGLLVYNFEGRTVQAETGKVVIEGRIIVEQPLTAYLFTGQGSQTKGMGMDLYEESEAAREIWDRADVHFKKSYGVSIIDIVTNNPKQVTVYFGGTRGHQIRKTYQSLTFEDPETKQQKPLIPSITDHTDSFTFSSPTGLLNATQFTQPALTLVAKAAFEDMKVRGLVAQKCSFAGHSLGEYASLAAVGDIIPIETLCDIVFYRGLTMQSAVKRDALGRSDYGMIAVSPTRISPDFKEFEFKFVVQGVREALNGALLEIVNYNIEDGQYVVAGELRALEVLTQSMNFIKHKSVKIADFEKEMPEDQVKKQLKEMVDYISKEVDKKGPISEVSKGYASIPLVGIDVPFHSSYLLSGVGPFRSILRKKLDPALVSVDRLCGRYIPNLVGEVFELTPEFFQKVYDASHSPIVAKIIKSPLPAHMTDHEQQLLAHTLLVELLSYQFASPVQWIKTQDVLFGEMKIEKIVEIGPMAVLSGMAEKTIKAKYAVKDDVLSTKRTIWSFASNRAEIYYESKSSVDTPKHAVQETTKPQTVVVNQPQPNYIASPAVSVSSNPPITFEALDALRLSFSVKVKRPFKDIQPTKSIKELSGGKSTLQNELLADLQREFGDSGFPERAEELPIQELAASIQNYHKMPRKHTALLLNKLWSSKMPTGFTMSAAKTYLSREYGFNDESVDAVLLFGAGIEPEKRVGGETEAYQWLDSLVKFVGDLKGKSLGKVSAKGANSSSQIAISSEELESLKMNQQAFAKAQLEAIAGFLGENEGDQLRRLIEEKDQQIKTLQAEAAEWIAEHGEEYASGIHSLFTPQKARIYDSSWNWGKQELHILMLEILTKKLNRSDRSVMERCGRLLNKSDADLIAFMEYHIKQHKSDYRSDPDGQQDLQKYGIELLELMREAANQPPRYRDLSHPTSPSVSLQPDGTVKYAEVPRKECRNFLHYVAAMERPFVEQRKGIVSLTEKVKSKAKSRPPLLSIRRIDPRDPLHWTLSMSATKELFGVMREVAKEGLSLHGKTAVVTGCGRGSIGEEVVKGLLSAGVSVLCTTSSYNPTTLSHFKQVYMEWGAKGTQLIVVPFNQASLRDIHQLAAYIDGDLKWTVDFFLPFAAINESGTSLEEVSGKNELAHRAMLTNVYRLLAAILRCRHSSDTRPTHCILPMSPNQGTFGGDGLYGESKAGLQALLKRWSAESWRDRCVLVGAVIGWTRGTGLMNDNNLLAAAMEGELGVRTFSAREQAFNILCLLHHRLLTSSLSQPVYADLSGGLSCLHALQRKASDVRLRLMSASRLKRTLFKEQEFEQSLRGGLKEDQPRSVVKPSCPLTFSFNTDTLVQQWKTTTRNHLKQTGQSLRRLLDLDKVVVVVGFGEVGPFGSARTRWQVERDGELSPSGYLELAWSMGLIEYHPQHHWIDTKTKQTVPEWSIRDTFGKYIQEHTGIRSIEPSMMYGYDPTKREQAQEHCLTADLPFVETSKEEAESIIRWHGRSLVDLQPTSDPDRLLIRLKKGAKVYLPKASSQSRRVAGLLPTGWDAGRFGVPQDVCRQVDPVTLFNLVSTSEALLSAGICDPYELYEHVHVSQVGNCSGGGEGGLRSNQRIFKDRFFDIPTQSDVLQESFISTMPAWVNLLLLSSSGVVKSPVGACATAVQSLELGVDAIINGKAKVVIVGGYDDISEESSGEFASMQATSNTLDEERRGRPPREQCRPATSTRAGFMESHGAGTQVLMSARLAIEMGCPIYGVVAGTSTASDRQGRSVPAPGQGLLTTARRVEGGDRELLSVARRLEILEQLGSKQDYSELQLDPKITAKLCQSHQLTLGHHFWQSDPTIAPLEGMLATFGLSVDDIHIASFHGTGTKANDSNECAVVQRQLEHLGRSTGNLLPCIFQKHLTGHPKGAACAWMVNGVLQSMQEAVIPGNRNADNIAKELFANHHLFFPNQTLPSRGDIMAAVVKSFGFGQVGGEAVLVSPMLVWSMLGEEEWNQYEERLLKREQRAIRYFNKSMLSNSLVKVKNEAPYKDQQQAEILLNPLMRRQPNGQWHQLDNTVMSMEGARGIGVDIQYIPDMPNSDSFLYKNFTESEQRRILSKPDRQASLAGVWAGKEAAFKALSQAKLVESRGEGASLLELQVDYEPAPVVRYKEVVVRLSISHSGDYAIAIARC